ncbi:MAG: sigma-54-dependent Fis family transcriptional regulator [Clostridiales Family XIII bacterium]|jgi:transcriptional regulator of acetoin/glycerol metabolism|nr:sigma-54-dependent Fis family transcriptional regulator [Clostridiales Family XIII bacterium]
MNMIPNIDPRRIEALWLSYVAQDVPFPEEVPEGIRPEILQSWERSKKCGVSPFEVNNVFLSKSRLEAALEANRMLITVAHPYLTKLFPLLKGSNFLIALTDRNGYVIDLVGLEGEIEQRAKRSALIIGCCRSEETTGTCGIGVCIKLGRPVQIWGAEHYIRPHHGYVCSAAPIKDERDALIGTIDVIGPFDEVTTHTLAMACAAADGIEKEIKMRKAYKEIEIANSKLLSTLRALSQGIVMIDNKGLITQANDSAAGLLKLSDRPLTGAYISDLLDLSTSSFDISSLTHNVSHRELAVTNVLGTRLHLSTSASIIKDDEGGRVSTVLVLEERRQFNKMATRASGFTARYSFDQITGESESIQEIKQLGMLAAHSNSNVLILGESGTGKELLAQSIHNASPRAKAPFIAINCGSLPRSLVESELFGYEAGAFTGASKNGYPGKFELADGGTLFLDEIGDMPLEIQVMLLRVIQTREILRIGGKMPKNIDVRIIAATNTNLAELIEGKQFRKDLYYRLNVLTFHMPTLRQRKDDLEVLLHRFIENYNRRMGLRVRGFTATALNYIAEYDWPGNIRELENMVERAMHLATGEYLTERELSREILRNSKFDTNAVFETNADIRTPAHTHIRPAPINKELSSLLEILASVRGNVTKASSVARIPKRTLYRKIERYGIDLTEYRL